MKKFDFPLLLRWLTPFLGLLVLILLTWFASPSLSWSGTPVFNSISSRILASFVIGLTWVLGYSWYHFFHYTHQQPSSASPKLDPETEIALENLTHQFQQAEEFLKETPLDNMNPTKRLIDLPWWLVLGASGSGKTTLLANAGIPYIFSKKISAYDITALPSTERCDWWVNSQHAFIDINGHYIDSSDPLDKTLWHRCIEFFKQKTPPQGILLTLDLPHLIGLCASDRDEFLTKIFQRFMMLTYTKYKQPIPIVIVFTKLDKIEGFSEFFNDLDAKERAQSFTVSLMPPLSQSLTVFLKAQLDALLVKFNRRVIVHLHQTHNIDQRAKIKDFPLSFESILPTLLDILQDLSKNLSLRKQFLLTQGYFTSSIQKSSVSSPRSNTISETFAITPYTPVQATKSKSYFCHALLSNELSHLENKMTPSSNSMSERKSQRLRWLSLLLGTSLVIGSTTYFIHSFKKNVSILSRVQTTLSEYQLLKKSSRVIKKHTLTSDLMILSTLQEANALLKKSSPSWLFSTTNASLAILKKETQSNYQQALTTLLLPRFRFLIQTQLDHLMQTNTALSSINQSKVYGTLKAYLMLSDLNNMDPSFLTNWLAASYGDLRLTSPQFDIINAELHDLINSLSQKETAVPDQLLVEKARKTLTHLTPAELAYVIVQNKLENHPINPFVDSHGNLPASFKILFNLKNSSSNIPILYTKMGYQTIFLKLLPTAINEATMGDAVTGPIISSSSRVMNSEELANTISTLYLSDYVRLWQTLMQQFTLKNITSLNEANQYADAFLKAPSALLTFATIVKENTDLNGTSLLPEYTLLLDADNTGEGTPSLNTIITSLSNYQQSLKIIENSSDSHHSAFDFIKNYFSDQNTNATSLNDLNVRIASLPEPLKTWLTQFTQETYSLLLKLSHDYLTTQWQTVVLTEYNKHINHRYPIFTQTDDDISLEDFTHFFGPQGTLAHFFGNYLSPFIGVSDNHWFWKTHEGLSLALSEDLLKQMRRAKIIQMMFFPDPNKTLNLSFSLTPIAFEPIVKTITLELDGESVSFSQGNNKGKSLTWPSLHGIPLLRLNFITVAGKTSTLELPGQWALFRLLQRANLRTTSKPTDFEISLELEDSAAEFELSAQTPVNAFIPGILSGFQCPIAI